MSQTAYEIPQEYFHRIHHVRPRFKNSIEDVLLFVAERIAGIDPMPAESFEARLFSDLRSYPGNLERTTKTINNWRTEISSLFGFVVQKGELEEPGTVATRLAESGDLVEFFRRFLLKFQYPGGHVKPRTVAEQIQSGIRFHPAKFIIEMFFAGRELVPEGKEFSVSSAEVTHCVFNDLRVTSSHERGPGDCAQLIRDNLRTGHYYDERGDVIRYAGDILDYLVVAGILERRSTNLRYYFKDGAGLVADAIVRNATFFTGYDRFYGLDEIVLRDVESVEPEWFHFVNQPIDEGVFSIDLDRFLEREIAPGPGLDDLIEGIRRALDGTAKDIGLAGESLTVSYEKGRLTELGFDELARKVMKIPDQLALGFDIQSFEGIERDSDRKKLIEVKTTRSHGALKTLSFVLTPNEWGTAKSSGDSYYVFRIMLAEDTIRTFVIRDPFGQYVKGLLDMRIANGAIVTFTEDNGQWIEIVPPRS
jgi:hypothetical protein